MAFFPGTTGFALPRRLVRRCGEMLVAASPSSPARNYQTFVGPAEVMQAFARVLVIHDGPHRDFQHNVGAVTARPLRTFTVPPAFGGVFRIKAKVHQRVVPLAGFHHDVAALAAVAARGAAAGDKLLPTEGHASVAAV